MNWNAVAHWMTLPIKPILFATLNAFRFSKFYAEFKQSLPNQGYPDYREIKTQYDFILKEILPKSFIPAPGGLLYRTNPDHQILRTGSLMWSAPNQELLSGIVNFIHDGICERGIVTVDPLVYPHFDAPPAMPMSIAFAMTSAKRAGLVIPLELKAEFLEMVDRYIENEFTTSDCTTRLRAASTAMDAVFACSLLLTAAKFAPDPGKYLRLNHEILFEKGYHLLLASPITWLKDRKGFLEHIMLFGAWTAYQNAETEMQKMLFRNCIQSIWKINRPWANPYYAALTYECGALSGDDREYVLRAHQFADPLACCEWRDVVHTPTYPADWTHYRSGEFPFDAEPRGFALPTGPQKDTIPLSGLCLAKSLMVLMADSP